MTLANLYYYHHYYYFTVMIFAITVLSLLLIKNCEKIFLKTF